MWTADEIDDICIAIRGNKQSVDDELLAKIDSDIDEYRESYGKARGQELEEALEPPPDLWDRLWSMGWLLYEASLQVVQQVKPADQGHGAADGFRMTERLYHAALALPWPQFSPRALGAIRAHALMASKKDTTEGFLEAFDHHDKARKRHADYVLAHGEQANRDTLLLGLDEVLLQLVLAETGTACRTAERVIGRWTEELLEEDGQWDAGSQDYWIQLMFRQLLLGVQIGSRALEIAADIERRYGFVDRPGRDRLALPTAFRNPGIMTARAALLVLAMSWEVEELQRRRPSGGTYESWDEFRTAMIDAFVRAYRAIEKPVADSDGAAIALIPDHQRSLVQIRLNAALILPGFDLPAELRFASCLDRNPLNDDAVEAMSGWLAEKNDDGVRRGDANVIGSATMPLFNNAVDKSRANRGVLDGYRGWRRNWFELDRYASEDGRRERSFTMLDA